MNKISIALFKSRPDAEPFERRLREAGVPAEAHDCSNIKGARIDIPADQFERAHQLLLNWDSSDGGLSGVIRCPECNSFRIEYPQYTHKSALPNLLVGALANIGALRKEFYCDDCHYTWPKEGTKPSRVRPHMAPYYFIEGIPQHPPQPQKEPEPHHAA
ncbi:MAG TPA: hypothetical protein VN761_08825 [Candidatus Polarisedimenticolia bacterium]|nr:hypothetical protein [Candidatus Polarisedimenticolia bacterium]